MYSRYFQTFSQTWAFLPLTSCFNAKQTHKADNLLSSDTYRKWKAARPGEKQTSVILQVCLCVSQQWLHNIVLFCPYSCGVYVGCRYLLLKPGDPADLIQFKHWTSDLHCRVSQNLLQLSESDSESFIYVPSHPASSFPVYLSTEGKESFESNFLSICYLIWVVPSIKNVDFHSRFSFVEIFASSVGTPLSALAYSGYLPQLLFPFFDHRISWKQLPLSSLLTQKLLQGF